MLTAHRLSHSRHEQPLFSSLNLALSPREILHITGANGCGKSTLLHILLGLLLPEEGEVYWQGLSITAPDAHYRTALTYIGHKTGIKHNLTVLENLQLAVQLTQSVRSIDWEQVLQYFSLNSISHTLCGRLSAGQKQRVALTRLLLTDARLWILDEPFTSLDASTHLALQNLLVSHTQRGGMVVLTTHHRLEWEEVRVVELGL